MNTTLSNTSHDPMQEEKQIDIRALLMRVVYNWPLVLACLLVAFGSAWLYLRVTPKIYQGETTLLVKDPKSKGLDAQALIGLDMISGSSTVDNEQQVLHSTTLTYQAIRRLPWRVSVSSVGRLHSSPVYDAAPFVVIPDTLHVQRVHQRFDVVYKGDGLWNISTEGHGSLYDYRKDEYGGFGKPADMQDGSYKDNHRFGDTINGPGFRFLFAPGEHYLDASEGAHYFFTMNSLQSFGKKMNDAITIEPASKTSTVLKMSMKNEHPRQLADFLNALAAEYLAYGLNKKNEVALRTIEFIDEQLDGITSQLSGA